MTWLVDWKLLQIKDDFNRTRREPPGLVWKSESLGINTNKCCEDWKRLWWVWAGEWIAQCPPCCSNVKATRWSGYSWRTGTGWTRRESVRRTRWAAVAWNKINLIFILFFIFICANLCFKTIYIYVMYWCWDQIC